MSSNSLTTISESNLPLASSGKAEAGQYLIFKLGDEFLGISIIGIKEIIECGAFTSVPMMPQYIRGVINLRGHVVPMMDLSARLGRDATVITRRTCIVIVEAPGDDGDSTQNIGIMVDAISAVLDFAPDDIEPPPAFGAHIRTELISGMARRGECFTVLLDVGQLLALDQIKALGQAVASAA